MKEYTVTIGGVEHQMLLDEEDAKRYQASESTDAAEAKSAAPQNKSRTTSGK